MRRELGAARRRRRSAGIGVFLLAVPLAAACAQRPAIETPAGATTALRGARTVWIAGALMRTGPLAAGEVEEGGVAGLGGGGARIEGLDVRGDLERAVRRVRGLELAADRSSADLVLYFEQADRLRCWRCRQPSDRWYWWGLVRDASGRELASFHGETTAGADEPPRRFVTALRALTRGARGREGDPTR